MIYAILAGIILFYGYRVGKFQFRFYMDDKIHSLDEIAVIDDLHWGARYLGYNILLIALHSNIRYQILAGLTVTFNQAIYYYIDGTIDFIPIMTVLIIGEKKCFTLMARVFEYDYERQTKDGAFLASLISSYSIQDKRI